MLTLLGFFDPRSPHVITATPRRQPTKRASTHSWLVRSTVKIPGDSFPLPATQAEYVPLSFTVAPPPNPPLVCVAVHCCNLGSFQRLCFSFTSANGRQ